MSDAARNRGKGCRIGCLIFLIPLLLAIIGGIFVLGRPLREAKSLEQTVNDSFGWAEEYCPSADGAVPAGRVEAFLRVRETVVPHCAGFQGTLDHVRRLEKLEDEEEMPAGGKLAGMVESLRNMLGVGPRFLEFVNDRNAALIAERMSLGEYVYIYLAAYSRRLEGELGARYAGMEEAHVSDRTRDEFVLILRNQLAALAESGDVEDAPGIAAGLRRQIAALERGEQEVPWPDGPPPAVAASLAPYAARLEALYCAGIVKVELQQKNRGLRFDG